MLDFSRRKKLAKRSSRGFAAWVIVTQAFTAISTGIALGYLMMFPVVYAFAAAKEAQIKRGIQNTAYRSPTGVQRQRSIAGEIEALDHFIAAFNPETPKSERCADPSNVFWFTSLLGIAGVASGLTIATAIERRQIRRHGGWALGMAVGARMIDTPTSAEEKQLKNIVEEIAIAYSSAPPAIVVMDNEHGINAFAAGLTQADSILCVTEGAMTKLDRDEMQALVAHEFSHLANGDTMLGTQMTSILLGLQGIRVLSEKCIWQGQNMAESHHANDWIYGYGLMAIGIIVWPFGLFGCVAATGLTLAMGRHREWLADAEAVQRTRNPEPLARALRKILGHPSGGRIRHPMMSLVAPMLFVEPSKQHRWPSKQHHWFATHPSIAKRIAAIDPNGDDSPIYDPIDVTRNRTNESPHTAAILDILFATPIVASPNPNQPTAPEPPDRKQIAESSLILMSAFSSCDGESAMTDYEFTRGWSELGIGEMRRVEQTDLADWMIDHAVKTLAALTPPQRQQLLVGIAATVSADGSMSPEELALLEKIQAAWGIDADRTSAPGDLKTPPGD